MELRAAIISTLAYFDLFDFPLTRTEVWRWLWQGTEHKGQGYTIGEVDAGVAVLITRGVLKEENGFVFFADREGLPALRESRYRHAVRKWRRARRWARVFSALPGVELVGVGNTLAYHNAKDGSDIDFFIVSAPGTIWRTRFFCAVLAQLFGLRPSAGANRDKLCLSFFVTSDALNLSHLSSSIAPTPPRGEGSPRPWRGKGEVGVPDIYLTYWTSQMVPLAGSPQTLEKYRAANAWVAPVLSFRGRGKIGRSFLPTGGKGGFLFLVFKILFWPLRFLPGTFLREWQKRKFPPAIREALGRNDGSVIVSDTVLKFHVNDRRAEIQKRWQTRVSSILHDS